MKRKPINILTSAAIIAALSFSACDPGDFDDLNVNPNQPSEPVKIGRAHV